ncbi:MAG: hypothetical protein GY717_09125 [Rhodobacteraceae bacterium]|nr:hypothetical protein [Paracoccaceae bacterium]
MSSKVDNQPLATVNGHIIYAGSLSREIEQLAATVHGVSFENLVPSQRAELKKNAITKLVREELVLESKLAVSVQPTEDELKAGIDEAQLGILVQGGDDIVDDEGFQKRLGESVRRELIIHHVIGLFLAEAEVSDDDVARFYQAQNQAPGLSRFVRDGRLDLAEIFLEAEKTLCPAGRSALILALRSFKERIEDGETFADLARKHSERAGTRESGGRIGWVRRGEINDAAFDAACAPDENSLTDVVPTPSGYLLMQVIDKDLSVLPLDEVRDEIRRELRDAQARAAFREWVSQLMAKADIRVGGDPSTWK